MPLRKKDHSIGRAWWRNFVSFGVPFGVALLICFYAHRQERIDLFIGAFVVGLALALAGLVRQQRLLSRYCCPECGRVLADKSQPAKSGAAIEFHCATCDITWETGFFYSSD